MKKMLTFNQIKRKYPDMWVLIGDFEIDRKNNIKKGRVLLASFRKRDILYEMHKFKGKVKKIAIVYTGKLPEVIGLFLSKVINFDPCESLITLKAIIKGKNEEEAYISLAFDTGATYTVISWDTLEWLGYDPSNVSYKDRVRLVTGSGIEFVPKVNIRALRIDSVEIKNIEVLAHDFPEEGQIDGVLDLNFIKKLNYYCINHKDGKIEIKNSKKRRK